MLPDNELIIEDNVTIGPNCTIHGTLIKKNSIIEVGAIICDYSEIGENCLVKAGSLVKQRDKFKENSIIQGFVAKTIGLNQQKLKKLSWSLRNK